MKVQLVMPRQEYREICSEGWSRPLGILTIGTYLADRGFNVEVIDGGVVPQDEIIHRVGADVVGLSTTIGNYRNSLAVARAAKVKDRKTRIILGGPEASFFYRECLTNRGPESGDYCVDAVVVGDGVKAFSEIVSGADVRTVQNVAYAGNGDVKLSRGAREDPSIWPIPDRSLLDMEAGFERYRAKFGGVTGFRKATNTMSQYGCTSKWCKFCGRTDRRWYGRDPEIVWEEVRRLVEKHGVDYIFDFSDSFTQKPEYVARLLEAKPKDLSPAFRFFARSDQTTRETARMMREMGAHEVYIGFESGDAQMLENMNKGTTPEQNIEAAKRIAEQGMKLMASFALGAPGETEESLQRTLMHAEEIFKIAETESILCSTWLPLPGSWSFEQIRDAFPERDDVDLDDLKAEWVRRMCNVDIGTITGYKERILDFAPLKDSKG